MIIRRRLGLVALVGALLAVSVWWWAIGQSLWVHDKNQIAVGMTRHEVIAAFGKPPEVGGNAGLGIWVANDGHISVMFGQDGKVEWFSGESQGFIYWQWRLINDKLFPPVYFVPPPPHPY